jgi:DNA-binding winged helix-turn-helix (wHTH) protein
MKKVLSLIDPHYGFVYSVDNDESLFRLEKDGCAKEVHIKPEYSVILSALFTTHPKPVNDKTMERYFRSKEIHCPTARSLNSEVRAIARILAKLHPSLNGFISDTPEVGYNLPVSLKNKGEQ